MILGLNSAIERRIVPSDLDSRRQLFPAKDMPLSDDDDNDSDAAVVGSL